MELCRSKRTYLGNRRYALDIASIRRPDPTLDLQVGASADDANELELTGAMTLNDPTIWLISYTASFNRGWLGFRWASGSLPPQGSTIDVAYAQVYVYDIGNDDVNGNLHFQLAASPASFTSANFDITSRPRTSSVSWVQDGLGTGWINTPSLVIPLQEVIDLYSPTALVLIGRPNQDANKWLAMRAWEFDDHSLAAYLHIEYSTGWTGKISGVTNPAKIMGIDVANIAEVKGVS